MKRWKVVTLAMFLCLNILLSFFTFSMVWPGQSNGSGNRKSSQMTSSVDQPIGDAVNDVIRTSRTEVRRAPLNLPIRKSYSSDTEKQKQERVTLLNYVVKPSDEVCTAVSKLVVAVCSSLEHFDRREAIRSTWGNRTFLGHLEIAIIFIVAMPRPEIEHLQQLLIQEHTTYGDIVQLNHTDHYTNLSLKSLGMLHWTLEFCRTVKFLLKTDDDVFVNVPNLIAFLDETMTYNKRKNLILGAIIQAAEPVRNRLSKWFMPYSVYRGNSYPPYTSGTAYLLSNDVAEKVFSLSQDRQIFWLEDIFLTGILAKELDVELVHDERFHYKRQKRNDLCRLKMAFTEHSQSPRDLVRIWNFAGVNSEMNGLLWLNCQNNSTLQYPCDATSTSGCQNKLQ